MTVTTPNPNSPDIKTNHLHLVLHDHGPADPNLIAHQLHSFGVCNPNCTDIQFAVFES